MAENNIEQQQLIEFERNRAQLMNVSAQKQQMQLQSETMKQALGELDKTKEKKVYKAIGNILIQSDVSAVKKELKEKKESLDLRVKTLQKQEDSLINKLNKIKSEIESAAKTQAAASGQDTVLETEKEKSQRS